MHRKTGKLRLSTLHGGKKFIQELAAIIIFAKPSNHLKKCVTQRFLLLRTDIFFNSHAKRLDWSHSLLPRKLANLEFQFSQNTLKFLYLYFYSQFSSLDISTNKTYVFRVGKKVLLVQVCLTKLQSWYLLRKKEEIQACSPQFINNILVNNYQREIFFH